MVMKRCKILCKACVGDLREISTGILLELMNVEMVIYR